MLRRSWRRSYSHQPAVPTRASLGQESSRCRQLIARPGRRPRDLAARPGCVIWNDASEESAEYCHEESVGYCQVVQFVILSSLLSSLDLNHDMCMHPRSLRYLTWPSRIGGTTESDRVISQARRRRSSAHRGRHSARSPLASSHRTPKAPNQRSHAHWRPAAAPALGHCRIEFASSVERWLSHEYHAGMYPLPAIGRSNHCPAPALARRGRPAIRAPGATGARKLPAPVRRRRHDAGPRRRQCHHRDGTR